MTKLCYTIAEAIDATGIKKTNLYEAIKSGELKVRKRGHRTLIRYEDLKAFVDALPEKSPIAA